jgi:hypothetical protein
MIDDEPLIPEEPVEDEEVELDDEGNPKKKKDLIDEDTESLSDLEEDELEADEDSYDDVNEQ